MSIHNANMMSGIQGSVIAPALTRKWKRLTLATCIPACITARLQWDKMFQGLLTPLSRVILEKLTGFAASQ